MLTGGFGEPYTFGRRLVKWFKREQPHYDIVHDNQSLCYGLLTLQKKGECVIATVHHPITRDRDIALASASSKGHRWLIKRWYSFLTMQTRVVNQLQHVITVSKNSQRDIESAFGREAARTPVIPNGVDISIFQPRPDIAREHFQLITTASSDQPLKGLSVLLQAVAKLVPQFPEITLVVIGKLNPGGASEQELDALQLRERVMFKSDLNHEDIVALYARATLAVVPSLYEGFGLPVLEAMACGIALISSDGGALPEVVGDAGKIVPANNSDALAGAIHELLTDETQRDAYAHAGFTRATEYYSWEKIAEQLTDYYVQCLSEKNASNNAREVAYADH